MVMNSNNLQNLILRNALKILFAISVIIIFVIILAPFIIPLTLGGILAMAFSPFISYFMRKGLSRKRSMQLLTIIILLGGVIPTAIFLNRGSHVIMEIMNDPSGILNPDILLARSNELVESFANITGIPRAPLFSQLEKLSVNGTKFLYKMFGTFLSEIPDMVLIAVTTILSTYFFLGNEDTIRSLFDRYFFFSHKNGRIIKKRF